MTNEIFLKTFVDQFEMVFSYKTLCLLNKHKTNVEQRFRIIEGIKYLVVL